MARMVRVVGGGAWRLGGALQPRAGLAPGVGPEAARSMGTRADRCGEGGAAGPPSSVLRLLRPPPSRRPRVTPWEEGPLQQPRHELRRQHLAPRHGPAPRLQLLRRRVDLHLAQRQCELGQDGLARQGRREAGAVAVRPLPSVRGGKRVTAAGLGATGGTSHTHSHTHSYTHSHTHSHTVAVPQARPGGRAGSAKAGAEMSCPLHEVSLAPTLPMTASHSAAPHTRCQGANSASAEPSLGCHACSATSSLWRICGYSSSRAWGGGKAAETGVRERGRQGRGRGWLRMRPRRTGATRRWWI